MIRIVTVSFLIALATINLASPLPDPQLDDDGQELLTGKDSRYYGYPFFWFGRPVYDDDDDDDDDDSYVGNGGQSIDINRRRSTVSYVNVGAGWGR